MAEKKSATQLLTDVPKSFGKRPDGSEKGYGFFGALPRADGKVSTELSTDDPIDESGQKILHPLIVPTLSRQELEYLLQDKVKDPMMDETIYEKAAEFARQRLREGKSPFAEKHEQQAPPQ